MDGNGSTNDGPLTGLKVLDLGLAGAGPICGTILAEWGADVIKVEEPKIGNLFRRFPPLYKGKSVWFPLEGRNKRYITVDMRRKEGQEIVKRLAGECDVVVENFRPGTMEAWNLSYEELRQERNDPIFIRISGFGQNGPYRRRTSYDAVGLAMGGLIDFTGYPGDPPLRAGWGMADYLAGTFGALAALIGLYHRNRKGEGQWAEVTQYESIFRLCEWSVAAYDKLGLMRKKVGNRHLSHAPEDLYVTKDNQWVIISASHESDFFNLCKAMGGEYLLTDSRFINHELRVKNSEEINEIVASWVRDWSLEEVLNIMEGAGVPFSTVSSVREVCENPHILARSNIVEVEDPHIGKIKVPNIIPKFSLTPAVIKNTGADMGAHNEEILKGLEYTTEDIEYLKDEGVICHSGNQKGRIEEKKSPQRCTKLPEKARGDLALEGLRVLEIGYGLAGNFAGVLLADFGTEVIKVEDPCVGDPLRHTPPLANGISLWWVVEGRNKKSITLDLGTKRGQYVFKYLVGQSHVVIESFQPGTLEKWNLGYSVLKELNQGVILLRISGFGQDGPYKDRGSSDAIASAITDFTYIHGFPEKPPVRLGISMAEYSAGLFGAMSIMAALYYKDMTGEGQWIDLALYEPLIRMSGGRIPAFHKLGQIYEREGNKSIVLGAPTGLFETRDRKWLTILAAEDKDFSRICKAMGREDWIFDPRFKSILSRGENADILNDYTAEWVSRYNMEEVNDILTKNEIPFSPIYSVTDFFHDPQYKANESIVEIEDPVLGKVKMQGVIPRLSLTPGKVRNSAPALGSSNEGVYSGLLRLDREEIASLKKEGII